LPWAKVLNERGSRKSDVDFEVHHLNLYENRTTLSVAKNVAPGLQSLSGDIRLAAICTCSLGKAAYNDCGCQKRRFSVFQLLCVWNLQLC